MEIQDTVNLILNSGVSIVVIAYFMYRDYKFIAQLQTTLTTLIDTVDCLKECVNGIAEKSQLSKGE
jgi:hypothetical protein